MKENKLKFQKLTPVSNIDLEIYEDALDFVFKNSDVKNVALSGAYGAGKSSVLESYKSKNKEIKFIHISLANFQSLKEHKEIEKPLDISNKEHKEIEKPLDISDLEVKILNQLIYKISPDLIPQTNFKIKRRLNHKSLMLNAGLCVMFLILTLYMIMFEQWTIFIEKLTASSLKTFLLLSAKDNGLLLSGIILFVIFVYFVYSLIKVQKSRNILRKLNLQGTEIEIFKECDDSCFNRHLNEILYLFESSKANVFVFEDLDRFDTNKIFARLKEINELLNARQDSKSNMTFRFFYLLRDDLFSNKDRTKFFDFIIPIVPVVDSSNSYNQLLALFEKGAILDYFDKGFLRGLSLYIDDMRLLKNIYNEFIIYYNRINITELDGNRMLAMIAYKNIFPGDYNNLQLNQGLVYTIFSKKNKYIQQELDLLENEKLSIEKDIDNAKSEHLKKMDELDIIHNFRVSQLSSMSGIEKQRQEEQYSIEFENRRKQIEDMAKVSELELRLKQIKKEIQILESKPLKEIINGEYGASVFKVVNENEIGRVNEYKELKGSEYYDLLKYLMRNGYIDETYPDYMTYFYENSLSRIDKAFLRSITDKHKKDATYKLTNPQMVIESLRLVDFDQEEVLNFDLIEHMLKSDCNMLQLKRIITQLKETKNYDFISSYFDACSEMATFVSILNNQWPEFLFNIIRERLLPENQIISFSINTLYYSTDDNIRQVNIDYCLADYISKNPTYLSMQDPIIDRLINGFIILEVLFEKIDYKESNCDLFMSVYENLLFEINFQNICLMLREIYKIKSESDLYSRNYTLIMSNSNSPLAQYVNDNIQEYISTVLAECKETINDDYDVAINILNNRNLTEDCRLEYIDFLQYCC